MDYFKWIDRLSERTGCGLAKLLNNNVTTTTVGNKDILCQELTTQERSFWEVVVSF